MSRYQKRVLSRSIVIGLLWIFFAQKYLFVGWGVSISGFLTIVSLGLRMGWKQEGMGTAALLFSIISFLGFLFGVIPVYTATPSLDAFYATKFPTIKCIENKMPMTLILGKIGYTMNSLPSISDICDKAFPIYIGQNLSWNNTGALVIDLGNASSMYLEGPIAGSLIKTNTGYAFDRKQAIGRAIFYGPDNENVKAELVQFSIAYEYQKEKKTYLKNNFPRVREQSAWLTKIAITKMKILGLFNREFNNYVKNIEFYMQEISN